MSGMAPHGTLSFRPCSVSVLASRRTSAHLIGRSSIVPGCWLDSSKPNAAQHNATLKAAMKWDAEVMTHRPRQENSTRTLDFSVTSLATVTETVGMPRARSRVGSVRRTDGRSVSGREQCSVGPFLLNHGLGDIVGYGALKLLRVHVVADKAEKLLVSPPSTPSKPVPEGARWGRATLISTLASSCGYFN